MAQLGIAPKSKGRRVIPSWLRERTWFSAACLMLSITLTFGAVLINRNVTRGRTFGEYGDPKEIKQFEQRVADKQTRTLACGAVLVTLAALWLGWNVRATFRRPRRGYCPRCNYDLTGLLSDRCPECGRPLIGRYRMRLDARSSHPGS